MSLKLTDIPFKILGTYNDGGCGEFTGIATDSLGNSYVIFTTVANFK